MNGFGIDAEVLYNCDQPPLVLCALYICPLKYLDKLYIP